MASNSEYEQRRSFEDNCCPGAKGGIKSIEIAHPQTITFKIDKPTKPFWEIFGHKSEEEMYKAQHVYFDHPDGKMICLTCNCYASECKLIKK